MKSAALLAVCVCLGAVFAAIAMRNAAVPRHNGFRVSERRQALRQNGHVSVQVACLDPTQVQGEDSQRPLPQYAPGEPIWLRIRITNESSGELLLQEPLEHSFVSNAEPAADVTWYAPRYDDEQTPRDASPHGMRTRFTRWPFLTEFGRRESLRRSERPVRTRISPGASIVRKVCFSNLYDVSEPRRWYSIGRLPFRIEQPAGEPVLLFSGGWDFQVTEPATNSVPDSMDALIVDE